MLVYHLLYYYDMYEDCFFITNRHGLKMEDLSIPKKFWEHLEKRFKYNWSVGHLAPVEFTYAIDDELDPYVHAISAVKYPDCFSRKIGRNIVSGRIKRALGDLTSKENQVREPYGQNEKRFVYYEPAPML